MPIPTEPIGSIPRPRALINAMGKLINGRLSRERMNALYTEALQDTVRRFEQTGSPVITDGEQTKPSFATYPLHGANNLASDGVVIPFKDGHTRQLPRLTSGPFSYQTHAESYLKAARKLTQLPLKQAVISASARSLIYPQDGLKDYPQDAFLNDLVAEAEADIRGCLDSGAHNVQIDFTEGRLFVKLDVTRWVNATMGPIPGTVIRRWHTVIVSDNIPRTRPCRTPICSRSALPSQSCSAAAHCQRLPDCSNGVGPLAPSLFED